MYWILSSFICYILQFYFFFYQGFLSWTLTTHRAAGKRRGSFLFHSTTFTRSRKFTIYFGTSHVRWLSHIFSRTACIYQAAATRWDLTPHRITIWLIDDVTFGFWLFICWFDSRLLLQLLDIGNRWIQTRID